jgi:RNA polymerase sigma-70 factor (ECF subfamily)
MAFGILGTRADALDVTQEALVAMWRGLPRLRDLDAFDGWLYRVTLNASRMALRTRRGIREIPFDSAPSISEAAAPDTGLPADSTFDGAFGRLSVEQRALLVQHHYEGLSIAELATLLEIPEGTVKSRLHAARAALERALEVESR